MKGLKEVKEINWGLFKDISGVSATNYVMILDGVAYLSTRLGMFKVSKVEHHPLPENPKMYCGSELVKFTPTLLDLTVNGAIRGVFMSSDNGGHKYLFFTESRISENGERTFSPVYLVKYFHVK